MSLSIDTNPLGMAANFVRHRYLLAQLVKRDVLLRYRGAMFGVLWIFLSPLLMLLIFAFVFGQIFQAKWPAVHAGLPFWLVLYSGLIAFNVFSETVTRAPTSVRSYPSYVKKIIFPVHILPVVPLGAALVHAAFNFLILLAALAWTGNFHVDLCLIPFLLAPLIMLALGLAWFLAAWGVFIKDMSQIVPIFMQMLLFLTPVFYPVDAVPAGLRPFYRHNPLGAVIESARAVVSSQPVDWVSWTAALGIGLLGLAAGYVFFQHSREEFADAL
jgi:lipopolysaccharide transport system permease protein